MVGGAKNNYSDRPWLKLQDEEKIEIKDQVPKGCGWARPIVQVVFLFFKVPLQLYMAFFQMSKWWNDEIEDTYRISTRYVYFAEFACISIFSLLVLRNIMLLNCASLTGLTPEKKFSKIAHNLESLYTMLFLVARFSCLMLVPFMAIRQVATSFTALLHKMKNTYKKICDSFESRSFPSPSLFLYLLEFLLLLTGFLTWWYVLPCAIIIKMRQMRFVVGDRWYWEWTLSEWVRFLGFLNQLSSMCETVELPQVFMGQFLYSKTSFSGKQKKEMKCFDSMFDPEKITGSILEYGPGVHYIRTKIMGEIYKEFSERKSTFLSLKTLAVVHAMKFGGYCKIFQHRLELGIEEPREADKRTSSRPPPCPV